MKLNFTTIKNSSYFKNRSHNIWLCISRMRRAFPKLRCNSPFTLEFATRPFTGSKRFVVDHPRYSIGGHQICGDDFRRIQKLIGTSKVVYVKVTIKKKQ